MDATTKLFLVSFATARIALAAAVTPPDELVLTDLTSPSGTITTTAAGSWVKPAKNAFDNGTAHNNDDRSICSGTTVDWIYTFDTPTKVNAYKVHVPGTAAYYYDKRMPKTWKFEAKNAADSEWTVLDTQASETGWTALESRYYEFPNNTAYDSYRFAVTANQAGSDNYVQIDELEFFFVNRGIPVLGTVALARTGAATYLVSATEESNEADLLWIADDGTTALTNLIQSAVADGTSVTGIVANLSADTSYQISVLATNEAGLVEVVTGTLYSGALALGSATDANENGLVAGGVAVSRASADPWPLTVNYTISGDFGTEGATWAAPIPVTIPAGAASATLPVVPLSDSFVSTNVTITVALAAGNYELPTSNSANLTLINRERFTPAGFTMKTVVTPSAAIRTTLGASSYTDFPVLLRLPSDVSSSLRSVDGTDLYIVDENDASLPFDVETFNPSGTSFVWVKVPSLSASTELTVFFGGNANAANNPTNVWTRYVGVWHFAPSAAGTTNITDATGHGLDGATTGSITAYAGPFGGDALQTTAGIKAPDYDSLIPNAAQFSASGWFKAPTQVDSYHTFVTKKTGLTWNDAKGWYLEMSQSKTKANLVLNGSNYFTIPDVSVNWNYFHLVSDGSTVKVYMNGSSSAAISKSYAIKASGKEFLICAGTGCSDERRIRSGAASAAETVLEYKTMADAAFFSYTAATVLDATTPSVATPVMTRDAGGAFRVEAEVSENVPASIAYDADGVTGPMATVDTALPMTYSATLSGLAADTTYQCVVKATSTGGSEVEAIGPVFYNGNLSISNLCDAVEYGLVSGAVRISRADTAHDLPVSYSVGGTATPGQTYATLSGTATIPAGSAYVDVEVAPFMDADTTVDTTVVLTLASGLYGIDPNAGTATVVITNLVAPSGFNVWVATADGLASVDSNWSAGHTPTSSENVLFHGDFSTANCEWDAAASDTVASWTQTNGYTGTVTFDTEFPDYAGVTFPLFTISGDCVIASGKWSCRGNYNNFGITTTPMRTYKTDKRWCLNVFVGGAMTVASGASVTATGRGYGFVNDSTSGNSQSYGGNAYGGLTAAYGSIKQPFDPGMGARSQSDQNDKIAAIGGGAIKLTVMGALTLDGSIVALGTADQNIPRSGGTGGSIWIAASQISGTGRIDASAPTGIGNDQIVSVGSGGRIALYTQSPLAFPMANVACNGTGYRGTSWSWNTRVSGPGTIYVYDPAQTNGTLYVKQSADVSTTNTKWTGAPVMGDLELDAVVLSGRASLRIPAGTSLTLPSLSAVTTDNTDAGVAGLVCAGGTLNIGNGNQTLKANVAFSSPTAFAFPGDLTLETGAKLGSLYSMYGTAAADYEQTFTLSVAGDLTIPADASAGARNSCALTAAATGCRTAAHGGQSLYLAADARTNGFDSVLNPSMPGGSMNVNFPAGGVFTLTVGGTLTLDGTMSVDGGGARGSDSTYDKASAGAGGTVNVTAGALAGAGAISADGGCGRWNYAGGAGGGRVTVRLTNAGAAFSDHWKTSITAYGESFKGGNGKASSAGTVYLQAGGEAEAAGTVVIRNDLALQSAAASNPATTRYPGNGDGCDTPEALKRTSLVIAGAAHVELTDSLRSNSLAIEDGSTLDLAGRTLTVKSANLNGVKVATGTYTADNPALADFVTDSGEGGALVVTGCPTILLLR